MKRQIVTLAAALIAALAFASSTQAAPSLVGKFCNGGNGPGHCAIPRGLAVDPATGHVYVADQGNDQIQELTAWGEFVRAWGGGVVSGGATGSGDISAESTMVTSVATSEKNFERDQEIEGVGIAPGTTIAAVGNGTITLSQPATASGIGVELVAPEGAGNVATNEVQKITVTATGGTYNLRFETPNPSPSSATTTANIPYNATAAEVQSALEGLANIGPGNVSVTSAGPSGPYTVEFDGPRFADTDVSTLAVAAGSPTLSGGTATVAVATEGASAAEICQAAVECRGAIAGTGAGQFDAPQGIAVDSSGSVFVTGFRDPRVQKFTPDGQFLLAFGGEVNKTTNGNVCTSSSGDECGAGVLGSAPGFFSLLFKSGDYIDIGPGNQVYVGDAERVQVFGSDGTYVKSIAIPGESVQSLATDAAGSLYVSYFVSAGNPEIASKPNVRKLSAAGQVLCTMQVENPRGIAVDGKHAYVISRPTNEAGVMQFDTSSCASVDSGAPPPGFGRGDLTTGLGTTPTGIATSVPPTCGQTETNVLVSNPNFEASSINLYGTAPDPDICPPPPAAPSIEAQFTTSVATTDAALRAKINPHFWPDTRYLVEYGTGKCSEGGCDNQQPASPGGLLTSKAVDASLATPEVFLEGLEPNTVYYYRFVSESGGGGPTVGEERSFRTLPLPGEGSSSCPNQAFRTGAGAKLPDCRAYEMVSPLEKENGDISTGGGGFPQASFDGERMTFSSFRSFANPESAPLNHQYLATRTAGGWQTQSIATPESPFDIFGAGANVDALRYKDFSDDLCLGWTINATDVALTPGSPPGVANLYRRDLCDGGYQLLTTAPPPGFGRGEEQTSSFYPELQGTSEDGERAAFRANASLQTQAGDPRAPLRCIADKGADTVAFSWLRDGTPIPGAEADKYTPTAADEGTALQCRTASSGPGGTSIATGKVMAIGPDEPRAPRPPKVTALFAVSPPAADLTGTPEVGETLTCTPRQWQGEPSFVYRWLRNGSPISGAEAADYTLADPDAAKVIQCELVASNAGGTAIGDSKPLLIATSPPLATSPPTISGTPEVGQTLTCNPGTWTGSPTFAYRWLRNGAPILVGGASASRAVVAGDVGKTLQCRVTATNPSAAVMATSDRVVVPAAPATTPPQQSSPGSITGTIQVGQTLTCDPGTWTGSPTFAYQWLRNGAEIAGAKASTYALQEADEGTAVQCQVLATNAGGATAAIEGSGPGVKYVVPDAEPTPPPAVAYSYTSWQVYLAHGGGLSLVSVLPDGTPATTDSSVGTAQTSSQLLSSSKLGKPGVNAVHNAVSADGERVFWSRVVGVSAETQDGHIFLRTNATQPQSAIVAGECTEADKACTLPVSELASPAPARFLDADRGGTRAFFVVQGEEKRLYEYQGGPSPQVTELAGNTVGFLGASEDATRAYFTSTEALTGAQENSEGDRAEVGKANLYLHERGEGLTFVAAMNTLDGGTAATELASGAITPERRSARVSPDGATVAFTTSGELTDYDSLEVGAGEPAREVYVYSASEDKLLCASCNPSGARPRARKIVTTWVAATVPGWVSQTHPGGALSDDGRRLYFNAYDSLVPGDTNGKMDVYQWEAPGKGGCTEASTSYSPTNGGCVDLISSGQSSSDSELFDATPSGSDVFFATASSLVPQDDGLVDVYDARVGGGFPQPPPPPPSCEGEACQGTPSPPNDPTPASSTFQGAGNVAEEPARGRKPCPKGKVRRKGRCVKKHKSSKHRKTKKHAKAGRAGSDRRNAR